MKLLHRLLYPAQSRVQRHRMALLYHYITKTVRSMHKTEPKPLTLEAVWNTAEALIFAQGSTTTPEVRQRLQDEGFAAAEAEISEAMAYLAEEDGWSFSGEGEGRSYFFEEDSDEVAHFYREYEGRFWEVVVVSSTLYCSSGRIGTLGRHRHHVLSSNRFAFFEARRMLADREAFGFTEAEDVRPDVVYRLPYWSLLNRKPVRVALKYHGVDIQEEVIGYYDNAPADTLRWHVEKRCSYLLQWDANLARMALKDMLLLERFDPLLFPADAQVVLDERITDVQVGSTGDTVESAAGDFIALAAPVIRQMEIDNEELESAVIEYADGQIIELQRQRWAADEFRCRLLLLCALLN